MAALMRPTLRKRLLSKAIINWETGCWEWIGYTEGDGYGRLKVEGRRRQAHRVVYELIEGPIPEGLQLDHLCRVRHCINPAHLEPVTPRENTLRGEAPSAKLARQTHCKRGHEFTPENTRTSEGTRVCRICDREKVKRWHAANSEAVRAGARRRYAEQKLRTEKAAAS